MDIIISGCIFVFVSVLTVINWRLYLKQKRDLELIQQIYREKRVSE